MADASQGTSLSLTISDLNVTINHEPRVLDTLLAERLGFEQPLMIRKLIARNRNELEAYGIISTVEKNHGGGRGRPATEYFLSEPQALVICALSRTPKAAEVRKALIEVFMAWRRGQLERPADPKPMLQIAPPVMPPQPEPFNARSDILRDLHSLVFSAMMRIEKREAPNFQQALLETIDDMLAMRDDPAHRQRGTTLDWNWKRANQRLTRKLLAEGRAVMRKGDK